MGSDQQTTPDEIEEAICAAQAPDGPVLALQIFYEAGQAINYTGNLRELRADSGQGWRGTSLFDSNDTLSTIWVSPQKSIWLGSCWGVVWTSAGYGWDASLIEPLDWEALGNKYQWGAQQLKEQPNIAAIWGSADHDVHFGTFEGRMYHWDGKAFSTSYAESAVSIQRMHGTSNANVWAVGREGLVLRHDGRGWRRMPLPGDVRENLSGVWALSDDEVYICSTAGSIFHGGAHGLERLGTYPHAFYGIVSFRDELLLAGGKSGACRLTGNRIEVLRDTFTAVGVYALADRAVFIPTPQPPARLVHFMPGAAVPWFETGV
jgi:hypothetical protein